MAQQPTLQHGCNCVVANGTLQRGPCPPAPPLPHSNAGVVHRQQQASQQRCVTCGRLDGDQRGCHARGQGTHRRPGTFSGSRLGGGEQERSFRGACLPMLQRVQQQRGLLGRDCTSDGAGSQPHAAIVVQQQQHERL